MRITPQAYPATRLSIVGTAHACYPMLRVEFSDGSVVSMLQPWVASPPRAHVPI